MKSKQNLEQDLIGVKLWKGKGKEREKIKILVRNTEGEKESKNMAGEMKRNDE